MHMKKIITICMAVAILVLTGCQHHQLDQECQATNPASGQLSQTDPTTPSNDAVFREEDPEFSQTKPVSQTDPTEATRGTPSGPEFPAQTNPPQTGPTNGDEGSSRPTDPAVETQPTIPESTEPPTTAPAETDPPVETTPPETRPPTTEPEETKPQPTEPEETTPAVTEITYEFKRQVAAYAAQYINQYRGSSCKVLSGMSQVAQYRASQLTYNYGHSTADKRAALAYYEYGRYIDATEFGDDASNSYWEADSAEAICAGFCGTDPEAMGKRIADLIRNSSGHWSYISSSEYSFIGVGVEYREGSEYGWYCCVMVGSVDYG